jgi:hypothetical protein
MPSSGHDGFAASALLDRPRKSPEKGRHGSSKTALKTASQTPKSGWAAMIAD